MPGLRQAITQTIAFAPQEMRQERRRERRVQLSIPCEFSLTSGKVYKAVTRDLAASGLAVSSSVQPEHGAPVRILFDGYGQYTGRITRVFEGGFAVSLPTSSLAVLALSEI